MNQRQAKKVLWMDFQADLGYSKPAKYKPKTIAMAQKVFGRSIWREFRKMQEVDHAA